MKGLFRCHFNYLFSKKTIAIYFISTSFILASHLISVLSIDFDVGIIDNNYLYFYNSFAFTKIISCIFSLFLFSYSFLDRHDNYVVLFIAKGISRISVFISKIIILSLFLLSLIYVNYFLYSLIGFIFYNNFIFEFKYLSNYLGLYLLCIYYGLVSLFITQLIKNIYVIIITFALFNVIEIINDNSNELAKIINTFFPYIHRNYGLYYGIIHIVLLIIILVIVNMCYYFQKDL